MLWEVAHHLLDRGCRNVGIQVLVTLAFISCANDSGRFVLKDGGDSAMGKAGKSVRWLQ